MSWRWYTEPLAYGDLCPQCMKPLRTHAGAGVVMWTDGRVYALACLLDKLAGQGASQELQIDGYDHGVPFKIF